MTLEQQESESERRETNAIFKASILKIVTLQPKLDDEEVAALLGIPTVTASKLLRELEAEGKIIRTSGK
jgi:DeoR/GlpR family transcriptional regulator of sugar metabolism